MVTLKDSFQSTVWKVDKKRNIVPEHLKKLTLNVPWVKILINQKIGIGVDGQHSIAHMPFTIDKIKSILYFC